MGTCSRSQLHRRFNPGRAATTTQRRLKRLSDAGLVERFQFHRRDGGGIPMCYVIAPAGLAALQADAHNDARERDGRDPARPSPDPASVRPQERDAAAGAPRRACRRLDAGARGRPRRSVRGTAWPGESRCSHLHRARAATGAPRSRPSTCGSPAVVRPRLPTRRWQAASASDASASRRCARTRSSR